jgi:hypothetical protein
MENSKLNQLLAKLDVLPMESVNLAFKELNSDQEQHLLSIYGSNNKGCSNSGCTDPVNINSGCVNSGCSSSTINAGCHQE